MNAADNRAPLKILIVDDKPELIALIKQYLLVYSFMTPVSFTSSPDALEWGKGDHFTIAIIDYKMPQINGLELIAQLKASNPHAYYILMTAHGNLEVAIDAIKTGVADFITKPFTLAAVTLTLDRIVDRIFLAKENQALKQLLREGYGKHQLVSSSDQIMAIKDKITTFADSTAPVLITGETGVGKEIVARMFHDNSLRKGSHFVAVNCSAYAETLFESELFGHEAGAFTGAHKQRIGRLEYARKGTLLFDEVSEMPLQMQVKLLRVLEEKEFERVGGNKTIDLEARIISATNRPPQEAIEQGFLRNDLYYRLNAIQVHIPPLRERPKDINTLAHHFMEKFSLIHEKTISAIDDNVLSLLDKYPWPGNVRQLENVIDYAVISCRGDHIVYNDLPEDLKDESIPRKPYIGITPVKSEVSSELPPTTPSTSMSARSAVLACLERNRWIKTKAAQELGLTRSQLLYRMKKFNIV